MAFLLVIAAPVTAQETTEDESKVTYPASYFAQYRPVSVNDMLNVIPGISLALEGNEVQTFNGANRGLGASEQILINGKRMAGKANEASSQLDRISAAQVQYIEIIRGTSGDLDVRNTGQLVNIVLFDSQSSSSLSTEFGATHFHDGTVEPIGTFSFSGQTGQFDYLLSAQVATAYEALESYEISVLPPGLGLNDVRKIERNRDQTTYTLNSNIAYQISPASRIAFNGLYRENDPSTNLVRTITDFQNAPPTILVEREAIPATSDNWEFGGDYEYNFSGAGKYKVLFIVNENNNAVTRERFVSSVLGGLEAKSLFLDTNTRERERIVRTSYAWNLVENQNLELGIERAQTILDSSLKIGLPIPGLASPSHGGLTPIDLPNAVSTVEEIRYEGFAVHNWQINQRMSLESSLLYEDSEISQSGDVKLSRSFDFLKPKVDFRFNMSSSFQLRLSAELDVSQLRFSDFTAAANDRDETQDILAGNPELEQEEVWRYNVNIDYRLPNDGGVLNSRLFYYDVGNSIDRIDVSTSPTNLATTNGNVGDGTVYGINLNASIRLGFLNLPQAVVTAGLLVQDSKIFAPLIAKNRKVVPFDRGNYRLGFRHDVPSKNFNYGFNYRDGFDGNRPFYDIDNVIWIGSSSNLSLFAERVGVGRFTYRFEADNLLDHETCRERRRFNGYLRDGDIREIERFCTTNGIRFTFKVRATF
ncbi:MAG: TonB-dependent receptor plug domain-containing protein [Gammaproteobacteria bacterium]|nr:TonB-dependent receptor plug domain-containing protein [Gammaproteobacteria bacterium]